MRRSGWCRHARGPKPRPVRPGGGWKNQKERPAVRRAGRGVGRRARWDPTAGGRPPCPGPDRSCRSASRQLLGAGRRRSERIRRRSRSRSDRRRRPARSRRGHRWSRRRSAARCGRASGPSPRRQDRAGGAARSGARRRPVPSARRSARPTRGSAPPRAPPRPTGFLPRGQRRRALRWCGCAPCASTNRPARSRGTAGRGWGGHGPARPARRPSGAR